MRIKITTYLNEDSKPISISSAQEWQFLERIRNKGFRRRAREIIHLQREAVTTRRTLEELQERMETLHELLYKHIKSWQKERISLLQERRAKAHVVVCTLCKKEFKEGEQELLWIEWVTQGFIIPGSYQPVGHKALHSVCPQCRRSRRRIRKYLKYSDEVIRLSVYRARHDNSCYEYFQKDKKQWCTIPEIDLAQFLEEDEDRGIDPKTARRWRLPPEFSISR